MAKKADKSLARVELGRDIIVMGTIGTWCGPQPVLANTHKTCIEDIMCPTMSCDSSIEFEIDENNDLVAREAHHDGVNNLTFRVLKPNCSCENLFENEEDEYISFVEQIKKVREITSPLGIYFKEIPFKKEEF